MNLAMLKLDQPLTTTELAELAKFLPYYDGEPDYAILEERFGHDQSPEFYLGMATALELVLNLRAEIPSEAKYAEFLLLLKYYTAGAALVARSN